MVDPKPTRVPTDGERFVAATRQVLSVSKVELERREKAWRRRRKTRKTPDRG
jgi:hypothetical protein